MKKIITIWMILRVFALSAQDSSKIATVVATSTGETIEFAKKNALRNAIEQAFGTFISSKTEVLNDELVKDEIVSISNGNIQKYEILAENQIQNNLFSITLRAVVSINKLVTYCQSKGISAEFQGGLFSVNIKQKQLNQESELKAVKNILEISNNILVNSLDFNDLNISEPVLVDEPNQKYSLNISFKIRNNPNYQIYLKYLRDNLTSVSILKNELESYSVSKIPVYKVILPDLKEIYLRNKFSAQSIKLFSLNSNKFLIDFRLISNVDTIAVSQFIGRLYGESIVYDKKFSGKLEEKYERLSPDIFYFENKDKVQSFSKIEHTKLNDYKNSMGMFFRMILQSVKKEDFTKLDLKNQGLYDYFDDYNPVRWLSLNCERSGLCDIQLQSEEKFEINVKISHILDFSLMEKLNGYKIEKFSNNNF